MLVLALVRGNDEGWGSTLIVSLFAGAAALLAAFVAIESRVREPMLPLGLFRRPSFTGVQLAAFAVSASVFALFLYLGALPAELPRLLAARRPGCATCRSRWRASSPRRSPALLLTRVPARVLLSAGARGVGRRACC